MKKRVRYICQECGNESQSWYGKCPGCGNFNTLVEEIVKKDVKIPEINKHAHFVERISEPISILDVGPGWEKRFFLEIKELDRVLGGGLVPGSLTLIGGDPGIGKSTLLLQVAAAFAEKIGSVLYVSGEESVQQIRIRAERLNSLSQDLMILSETNLEEIEKYSLQLRPQLLIIDSIQTIYSNDLTSAPGSVSQVRHCTARIMYLAKSELMTVMIVGHVTKDGALAGPRVLEHMVDTVLYFEGDRHQTFRLLRTVKNRFGSTNEIGVFEMSNQGLAEVFNPSNLFLRPKSDGYQAVSGSVVVAAVEGTRPILIELQALVSPATYGTPRRMTAGVDFNRVVLILAVLEKRLGLPISGQDTYINVVGGVKIDEPAVDLGIALAIASSFKNQPIAPDLLVLGEIGLTGEIRPINLIEKRVLEAKKLGFKSAIIPFDNLKQLKQVANFKFLGVKTIAQALEMALD